MRDETSSGGLLANDCLVHFSVSSLPFGGVGEYTRGQFYAEMDYKQESLLLAHLFTHSVSHSLKGQGCKW